MFRLKNAGVICALALSPSLAVAGSAGAFSEHLSASLGARPLFAINSPPVISNVSGESYQGTQTPFIGGGLGAYGDIYYDDKYGFELGYSWLLQNQTPRSPRTPSGVRSQTITYISYLLKYKPDGRTEYGFGGGQFDWVTPTKITQTLSCGGACRYTAVTYESAPVSASGFILHAAFPLSAVGKLSSSCVTQLFLVPDEKKQLFGLTIGVNFGFDVFRGAGVPAAAGGAVPYSRKVPWR